MTVHGPFVYSIEERQVVRAMQDLLRRRMTRGVGRWLLFALVAAYLLLVVLDLSLLGRLSNVAIAMLIAVPVAALLVHVWMAPMMGRRQFRQSALLRAPVTLSWDEEALSFASEHGQARLPFSAYHGWSEIDGAVLLYQTEMFFNIVPKAALGEEAVSDLIDKLRSAGVRRT